MELNDATDIKIGHDALSLYCTKVPAGKAVERLPRYGPPRVAARDTRVTGLR